MALMARLKLPETVPLIGRLGISRSVLARILGLFLRHFVFARTKYMLSVVPDGNPDPFFSLSRAKKSSSNEILRQKLFGMDI
jgi:hypothetical protein